MSILVLTEIHEYTSIHYAPKSNRSLSETQSVKCWKRTSIGRLTWLKTTADTMAKTQAYLRSHVK